MTVQTTTLRADYTGNGSTTAFTVPFYFLDNTHVLVIRTQISTGTATTLALTTDYTVSGAGVSTGGTVTCLVAPTADQKVSILRNVPFTQLTHYVENDPFPAASHEKALDQLTMEVQQLQEAIARSIKISQNNTISTPEMNSDAASRANKVISFDSNGDITVSQAIGTWRGNWAASVAYAQRDIIKDTSNNNIYLCLTGHTSSGSQPISTNTDAAKWALLVDAAAAASSATAAAASASAASTSATNAANSASAASTSASNASTSATNAANSATAASGSASSASTSAANAANSATAAAASASSAAWRTSSTGSAQIPSGTSAQRDGSPLPGYFRLNTDTNKFEGYKSGAWGSVGGGATGGGSDDVFVENSKTVTSNYTITAGKNAGSFGPVTINDGVTVTIPDGSVWTIV